MEFIYEENWPEGFIYQGISMAFLGDQYYSPVDSFMVKHIAEERDVKVLVCIAASSPTKLAHLIKGDDVA